jgi:hypothetical protein
VIEHGNAILTEQITQAVCLAGDGGFGDAEEDVGNARLQSRVPERRQDSDGLHQGLGRAARLGNCDETAGRVRKSREQLCKSVCIEVIDEA